MSRFAFTRLLAPAVLAAGLGLAAFAPSPARASDDLVRIIVDVADVIYHGGHPYYRYGPGHGYGDRLIVVHDRYRRPTYYRYVPRTVYYQTPPRGHAYGYHRDRPVYVRYVDRDDRHRHDHRRDRNRWDGDRRWNKGKHDRRRGDRDWDD